MQATEQVSKLTQAIASLKDVPGMEQQCAALEAKVAELGGAQPAKDDGQPHPANKMQAAYAQAVRHQARCKKRHEALRA
eukprot:5615224-Alexandrium_andersonii.AAC.1